jgi:hypothetical protein
MMEYRVWKYQKGVQPPMLAPLIGLKVENLWILYGSLLVLLERGNCLRFTPVANAPEGGQGINICHGTLIEGRDLSAMDRFSRPSPHIDKVRGLPFQGIDRDVVMFGKEYGAMLSLEGLRWVKAAG